MLKSDNFRNKKTVPYKNQGKKSETNMFGIGAMDNHEKLNPSTTYRADGKVFVCCCAQYNCGGAVKKGER